MDYNRINGRLGQVCGPFAATDGALRDANSNINELLAALTWIEG